MNSTLIEHTDVGGRARFNSLGIPVDDLTESEAVDRIVELVHENRRRARAGYVATLNVDFLVNAVGSGRASRHPELLDILRNSDLTTADGFPVVLLSRIMGAPIRERVTGADLVPALAKRAASSGLSIYYFGGREGVAQTAAKKLANDHPGLRTAGHDAPWVSITGNGLLDSDSVDTAQVEAINRSGADILLLGLGNPKQELWFQRNQHRLTVPVSIGVGGTFEFVLGSVKRAPIWMQRSGLEWMFRITQDPRRLWKRYARGMMELAAMALPLLWMRTLESLRMREARSELREIRLWCSKDQALRLVRVPKVLTRAAMEQIVGRMENGDSPAIFTVVDFSLCLSIDLAAIQGFYHLNRILDGHPNQGSLVGVGKRLRAQLRRSHVLDVLTTAAQWAFPAPTDARSPQWKPGQEFHIDSYALERTHLVYLRGRISYCSLQQTAVIPTLEQSAKGRTVVIDLRHVALIDQKSAAQLQEFCAREATVFLAGVTRQTQRAFQLTELPVPRCLAEDQLVDTLIGSPP